MKHILTSICLLFCIFCKSQVLLNEGFDDGDCESSVPYGWDFLGHVEMMDSCMGYATAQGFHLPASGSRYVRLKAFDRSSPNARGYIGAVLSKENMVMPMDVIYVEALVSEGANCQWHHNGISIAMSHGAYPSSDSLCSEGFAPQVSMASIFDGGEYWTAFGGIFTATDTLDRIQIGVFPCDSDLVLLNDTLATSGVTMLNVDNVRIVRLSTGVEEPRSDTQHQLMGSFNLLGQRIR